MPPPTTLRRLQVDRQRLVLALRDIEAGRVCIDLGDREKRELVESIQRRVDSLTMQVAQPPGLGPPPEPAPQIRDFASKI
jgi:hypothetical protein